MKDEDLKRDDTTRGSLEVTERLRSRYPELFDGEDLCLEAIEQRLLSSEGAVDPRVVPLRRARSSSHLADEVVLEPMKASSRAWEDTANRLIQGDNLEALAALAASGEPVWGEFDMVYLDPPYNTGNAFIYSDRHGRGAEGAADPLSSRQTWAELLMPRLVAARSMLKSTGFLCVSIDDHEVHTVRMMLDQVFGAANRVETIIVSMNAKGRQLAPHFALAHEYVLIYARELGTCAIRSGLPETVDPRDFPLEDEEGSYRLLPLRNTNKKFNPTTRPNLYYPLFVHRETGRVDLEARDGSVEVHPVFGSGAPAVWRWGRSKVQGERDQLFGREVRGKIGRRWDVFQKDYNHPGRTKKLTSVWLPKDIGTTDAAARELKARGVAEFDTPKPLGLMRRLCALSPPDARVADLYAGSGTTGEAVLQLNAAQGASRSFLLVQCDAGSGEGDPNIAELTRIRLGAACEALATEASGDAETPAVDLGFRVYRCGQVESD